MRFIYTFIAQILLIALRRVLLPHFPVYQTTRVQLQRAFMSSCSVAFPDLCWALPVGPVSETKARSISPDAPAYIIPGAKTLKVLAARQSSSSHCVIIYAHGGGYARGEARMYIRYMERWVSCAAAKGLDLTFISVEYRKL